MKYFVGIALCLTLAMADVAGGWRIYADAHFTTRIASLDNEVFVGSKGGLLHYQPDTENINIITNSDGLGDLHITGLAVHSGRLFYSGANGSLGRREANRFLTNSDLVRSGIGANDLISAGAKLFVATSQGISKLNILEGSDPLEIAENYTKLGGFVRNSSISRISADDTLIWAASEKGLAFGKLTSNLFIPDEWRNLYTNRAVTAVFADSGGAWFALERESGMPSIFWTDGETIDTIADSYMNYRIITDFFYYNGTFYAAGASGLFSRNPSGDFRLVRLDNHWAVHGGTVANDELFVGMEIGFGVLRDDTVRLIEPNTPWGNGFADMAIGPDEDMWIIAQNLGVMQLKDGVWTGFTNWTIPSGDSVTNIIRANIFSSYSIAVDGAGALWIGTNGKGVYRFSPDGEWKIYNETNSILRGISGGASVVVCRGLAFDPYRDILWVTNYAGTNGLLVAGFDPRGGLDSPIVSYSIGSSGIPNNNVQGITVDERGIWLILKDEGVVEISLGPYVEEVSDDQIFLYRDGLPSSTVNRIALDSEGRAWLAASGGVAIVDPRYGTVAIMDIPERLSIAVSGIDIDEWDNVWIVTDDGAGMFRKSDSTWHAIKSRYSTNAEFREMTDIPTDYLYSVKVNPSSGEVWFAGEGGIGVLTTGFVSEGDDLSELFSFPNPFVWDGSAVGRAVISGVPSDADLHIYSADGLLVRSILSTEKGPTAAVEWDGRNSSGKPVASGIYLLVAPSSRGVARGKIAVVREKR